MRPRIGFLVPRPDWSARVVGVYARAISLLHADGALVSLVRGPEDLEARAIALGAGWDGFSQCARRAWASSRDAEPVFVDYGETGRAGDTEGRAGRTLALRLARGEVKTGQSLGHGCTLELRGAEPWDPRDGLRRGLSPANGSGTELSAALSAARALLEAALAQARAGENSRDGIGGEGLFGKAFSRLKDRPDFPACLVGFGQGTTPAGDDWLAGFLAAAELCEIAAELREPALASGGAVYGPHGTHSPIGQPSPPGSSSLPLSGEAGRGPRLGVAALCEDIRQRLPRTGAAGKSLLLGALAGAPPAYIQRVQRGCLRCAADDGAELNLAIAAAMRHGASSGWDSLEGFRAGLESSQDFSPRG